MSCNILNLAYDTNTFDIIQLERLMAQKGLQSAALNTFLKYAEFAFSYGSQLENTLFSPNTNSSDDAGENFKQLYERMLHFYI